MPTELSDKNHLQSRVNEKASKARQEHDQNFTRHEIKYLQERIEWLEQSQQALIEILNEDRQIQNTPFTGYISKE